MRSANPNKGKEEACKTYIEQTKLLVGLASAFLVAPPAVIGLFWGSQGFSLLTSQKTLFVSAELCFVFSVLMGYVVLGSVAGSQDSGAFDVYRLATRISSWIQIGFYLFGLFLFVLLMLGIAENSKAIQPVKIQLDKVSDIGPFPEGDDCLASIIEDRTITDVKRAIALSEGKPWCLLLVGSADIRPLGTELQHSAGNNVGLANARAKCVKRLLLERFGATIDKERIVIFPDAPTYIGPSVGDVERAKDRRVSIFFIKTVEKKTK